MIEPALENAALAGWAAPKRSSPGGQPLYAELAIELVLTIRLVFHLALRQAEAFSRSAFRLLGSALSVPDHNLLSRRGQEFAGRQPSVLASIGLIHRVLNSTALELFSQRDCSTANHGRASRNWRKLRLIVNTNMGETAAPMLTDDHADDTAQVPALLGQAESQVASARVSPWTGSVGWLNATGYERRNQAKTATSRYKHLIGPKFRARSLLGQQGEIAIDVAALRKINSSHKTRLRPSGANMSGEGDPTFPQLLATTSIWPRDACL